MLVFNSKSDAGNVTFNLPTSLTEITSEYLKAVTEDVQVSSNYSLIAVCYREKLSNILLSVRQNKNNITTSVVPLFVKGYEKDNTNIDAGEKLIISPSDIALGHHVVAPNNKITIASIVELTKGDKNAYQNAIKDSKYCYFVEFKVVPNCSIIGVYKNSDNNNFVNPFVTINNRDKE